MVGVPAGVVHCFLPLLEIMQESYGVHEALLTEIKPMGENLITVDGPSKSANDAWGRKWQIDMTETLTRTSVIEKNH